MNEVHSTDKGTAVWNGFCGYRLSSIVNRAGHRLTGAYGGKNVLVPIFNPVPIATVLSHSATIAMLARLISEQYPEIISKAELDDYIFLAEIHDLGEIKNGDVPADGTRNDAACNKDERTCLKEYLYSTFGKETAERGLRLYDEFTNRSTKFGKIFYLLDKFDALLTSLFYEYLRKYLDRLTDLKMTPELNEMLAHKPCILDKILIHGRDEKDLLDVASTEYTQTTLPMDNFLYCEFYKPEFFSYPYVEKFFEIIQSATYAVRGAELAWLNIEIARRTSGYYN